MIKTDLHIHSALSPDAVESIDTICETALSLGLDTIAISDHYEFYSPGKEYSKFSFGKVEKGQKEVERARGIYGKDLKILFAIEIGQPHVDFHTAMKLVSSFDFDFILASFHKVGEKDLMYHNYLDDEERRRTLLEYLDGLLLIATAFDFDSLAHFDIPKRYSFRAGRIMRVEDEEERVREILKTLVRRDKALEVNTSFLRESDETLPGEKILKWFHEEGGRRITIGSDAHKRDAIGSGFDVAYDIIIQSGFSTVTYYEKRKAQKRKLL